MRARTLSLLAFLTATPMLAQADVPPPPDNYSGPKTVHVAGLTFVRDLWQRAYLEQCDDGHPNCALIKKLHGLGGDVTKIGDVDLLRTSPSGDLGVIAAAFAKASGKRVSLTLVFDRPRFQPHGYRTVTVDVSAR